MKRKEIKQKHRSFVQFLKQSCILFIILLDLLQSFIHFTYLLLAIYRSVNISTSFHTILMVFLEGRIDSLDKVIRYG